MVAAKKTSVAHAVLGYIKCTLLTDKSTACSEKFRVGGVLLLARFSASGVLLVAL
jgi:hypothetical protein